MLWTTITTHPALSAGIAVLALVVIAYTLIIVGARSDALDHTGDESAELNRQIRLGGGADFLHDGSANR